MRTVKRPFGSPRRSTVDFSRPAFTTFTPLPFTNTRAETTVTPGTFAMRIRNRRRLTHDFDDGSLKTFEALSLGSAAGVEAAWTAGVTGWATVGVGVPPPGGGGGFSS